MIEHYYFDEPITAMTTVDGAPTTLTNAAPAYPIPGITININAPIYINAAPVSSSYTYDDEGGEEYGCPVGESCDDCEFYDKCDW